MKALLSLIALAACAPVAAQQSAQPVAAGQETEIPSGGVKAYFRGPGDVIFVQHRSDRWYRVQLNDGCLRTGLASASIAFRGQTPGSRIDRFTTVLRPDAGVTCSIKSIQRSPPPPQIDSDSTARY